MYLCIQSFSDEYIFSGKSKDIYHQIGNAVPVKMAEVIANSIKKKYFSKVFRLKFFPL